MKFQTCNNIWKYSKNVIKSENLPEPAVTYGILTLQNVYINQTHNLWKFNKIKEPSITCSYIWHVNISRCVYWSDIHFVKVLWRYVLSKLWRTAIETTSKLQKSGLSTPRKHSRGEHTYCLKIKVPGEPIKHWFCRKKDKIRQLNRPREWGIFFFCIFGFSVSQNVKKQVSRKKRYLSINFYKGMFRGNFIIKIRNVFR